MAGADPSATDEPAHALAGVTLSLLGPPRLMVHGVAVAPGSRKALYERRYCARGEAENRVE